MKDNPHVASRRTQAGCSSSQDLNRDNIWCKISDIIFYWLLSNIVFYFCRWETLDSFMQHDVQELCRVVSWILYSKHMLINDTSECSHVHRNQISSHRNRRWHCKTPARCCELFGSFIIIENFSIAVAGQHGKQNEGHMCWWNHS